MKKNGFTLVEILAVIVILGVISTIAMTAVIPKINNAKKDTFIVNAKNILNTAEKHFVHIQTLNELPTKKNESVEGITYAFNVLSGANVLYTAYYMDIKNMGGLMTIDEDYDGYVFFADYEDKVISYIGLFNEDFTLYHDTSCLESYGNTCFYVAEKLNVDFVQNRKSIKKLQPNKISVHNVSLIRHIL